MDIDQSVSKLYGFFLGDLIGLNVTLNPFNLRLFFRGTSGKIVLRVPKYDGVDLLIIFEVKNLIHLNLHSDENSHSHKYITQKKLKY